MKKSFSWQNLETGEKKDFRTFDELIAWTGVRRSLWIIQNYYSLHF